MATRDMTAIVGADLRSWPCPPADGIPDAYREKYLARCNALKAVVGGMSYRRAAAQFNLDARTVGNDAEKAVRRHDDGKPLGFRACIPFRYRLCRSTAKGEPVTPPARGGAYSFSRLLTACEPLKNFVEEYNGSLPTGRWKARAFDRHFGAFKQKVRALLGDDAYPLREPDEGRRALLNHHKRRRKARRDVGAAEVDATPPTTKRFNQLFNLAPLDRAEFDAHKEDVDWILDIPQPNGEPVQRRITKVTLLALVCAVSRYLLSYLLVLGDYNHLHVLRLFRSALQPWRPRELIVPGMVYPEGATLGLPIDARGCGPRPILSAGDNALAHLASQSVENLVHHFRGIFNFGKAHVPEGRPIIEAFFRRLEQGALRHLAGGFQPETRRNSGKVTTSYLRSHDHPLHWDGMLDLMDVIASGYNVTPHSGLHNRLPSAVLDTHLKSGWTWQATEAARDAQRLATIRLNVRIRGDKSVGRHPFVQYQNAIYRSQRLMGRWDLVAHNERWPAEINIDDLRHLVLLDREDHTLWSRLAALPPWDQSAHDLFLRQQINRARSRGLLQIVGAEDAVKAYHAFALAETVKNGGAADEYARLEFQHGFNAAATPTPVSQLAVQPRAGRTSFASRKD